eukprot:5348188-Pyramimonas_sp.AAC.1
MGRRGMRRSWRKRRMPSPSSVLPCPTHGSGGRKLGRRGMLFPRSDGIEATPTPPGGPPPATRSTMPPRAGGWG